MALARDFVFETLIDVLPPGVPPSFREISSASFIGSGRSRRARAALVMFDGQPATVECWQAGMCRAHTFTYMPGGAVSWEDCAWVRCDDAGNILASGLSSHSSQHCLEE